MKDGMTRMQGISRIIIFAKTPVPGTVKTRLIPVLGATGAARLAQRMLVHTVEQALSAQAENNAMTVELCVSPDATDEQWRWAAEHPAITLSQQVQGDLGQRLHEAAARATQAKEHVILIGTDCPAITANLLQRAATDLDQHDAVICPTLDGGYALLGLRNAQRSLFCDIPWSTKQVARLTLTRLQALGLSVHRLATLRDIDEAADLAAIPSQWLTDLALTAAPP
jgi:rSAM/selenodomain-associated transferase 1